MNNNAQHQRHTMPLRAILASLIGNALEWFEYTLYAHFATIISVLFFPADGTYIRILMTFATFAVGLAARPIGGLIFGYIGDKYSRKKMLFVTMLLMSIPTLCIGVLPTYNDIGIAAPIILVILRVLQGIALGGEFGASCVYLYELAPPHWKSFYGTLPLTGLGSGLILSASTIFVFESIFTEEEILNFAWRIPFFMSVFGAIIALYIRRSLLETSDFIQARKNNFLVKNPIFVMLKYHKYSLLKMFSIFLTTQTAFFVVLIFGKTMMVEFLMYSNHVAGKYNLFTVISYTISTLVFGYISRKVNNKHLIYLGILGILFLAYPFVDALQGENAYVILGISMVLGALIGMLEGLLNSLVVQEFPVYIRATGVSFCWNFTAVAFGATSPLLMIWMIKNVAGVQSISWCLITVCTISLVSFLIFNYKEKIRPLGSRS